MNMKLLAFVTPPSIYQHLVCGVRLKELEITVSQFLGVMSIAMLTVLVTVTKSNNNNSVPMVLYGHYKRPIKVNYTI